MANYTFNVYLDGKKLDTVFASYKDPVELRESLIRHDGYDSGIAVRRVWRKWHVVQGYYCHGWEDECPEECRKGARARLREYRENMPEYPHRIVTRREQV